MVVGVRIEPGRWLLGVRVVDVDGRRLGRVAAAYCTAAPVDEDTLDSRAGRARVQRFYQPRPVYAPC